MTLTREKLIAKLEKLLGSALVHDSGLALPELLNKAAIEIFYNCDNDGDIGETSYYVRVAMTQLRKTGELSFE